MDAVSLGPFVMPLDRLFTLLALAGFLATAELMARRLKLVFLSNWAWNAVFAGLIAARLGYVAGHWPVYREDLLSVLYFWQGGFSPLWGLLGGLAYTLAAFRGRLGELRLVFWPAAGGALVAAALFGIAAVKVPEQAELPDLTLTTLAGAPRNLADYRGQPVVINVWATWCPPCRREMPMLAQAEEENPGVAFVFVNSGETEAQVRAFLDEEGLFFNHMLLDPGQRLVPRLNVIGYPTTFFFNRDGVLVARKTGELSRAALEDFLKRIR
ncbi:TlpA disulfide reductase family protein [Oceanithermus sp.]|uniref:TlpA disulfide reductase family protein n=1 Tax=Oceanithermus sp. TaxID=2268145 RepID=UPI0025803937|nr:TlpA disulfide reductase family protein [Oceanithermus sp.]